MTLFDLIVLGVLALSALVGFVRGAVREVVTVAAFVLAAIVSVVSLRLTAGLARSAIDPDWAAVGVAIVVVFVIVYIALRVLGASLTKSVQASAAGPVDRAVGVGFGLVRGLVFLGVVHLVLHAVTPRDRIPGWIENAAAYPLTSATAGGLRVLAREGSGQAGRFGPAIQKAVREAADDAPQSETVTQSPSEASPGYDRDERRDLDALVEERAR
jgi:membrane protein required for colicin V production